MLTGGSVVQDVARELEAELHRVVDAWFPRCLDHEHGGFLCDFDGRWNPAGAQRKMLEFQARQTLAAAWLAMRYPERDDLRTAAMHGFRYLKARMWDPVSGGWFWMLDRTGAVSADGTKHAHGTAYAISACVACYELTGESECLDLARSGFDWLEAHAHDDAHGGYFVFYRRDGRRILSREQAPNPRALLDPVGTPFGCKDANTTSDLLRGLFDLHRVWPEARLWSRCEELLGILRDRLVVAPGLLHTFALPDWTPLPDFVRYAQTIHSASYLLSVSEALAADERAKTVQVARSMIDTMLALAWDGERGGFRYAGAGLGPMRLEGSLLQAPAKSWWAQTEGMRALLFLALQGGDDAKRYASAFGVLWDYVKSYLIDGEHGGWIATGLDTDPDARNQPKATIWKDASHEVGALLACLSLLEARQGSGPRLQGEPPGQCGEGAAP
jgi:mannobiose 2-epimerase